MNGVIVKLPKTQEWSHYQPRFHFQLGDPKQNIIALVPRTGRFLEKEDLAETIYPILERYQEWKTQCYVQFIHFENAFDSIHLWSFRALRSLLQNNIIYMGATVTKDENKD